jgi:hypothetical protein
MSDGSYRIALKISHDLTLVLSPNPQRQHGLLALM